ncbi:hypothetical protein BDP55DRAFT_628633 [Colletotrichum godetiae]|uniref:Transcription factor domain-containing protein n=1 Tax=Colletotrichum godetiae TaxID=1209918 RepID=A0AAJ0AWA8_9PEZI|nr:uncharacterized protein BDP55DRAFT_628633 [Colletotrichum godetiae]KAK1689299.1 hypothetical protein BDP55DRAFT_628633 [Colletotrichum godetiae]
MVSINSCDEAQVIITCYRINGNRSLISRTRVNIHRTHIPRLFYQLTRDHSFSIASWESLEQMRQSSFTTSPSQMVVPQDMMHPCFESECLYDVTERSLPRMELTPELLGFISASRGVWRMLRLSEILAVFRDDEYEVIQPPPSVRAAVNIELIMTELPDLIAIGALLLMTLMFASTSRFPTAAMVLAIVSQMMFLAGFHKMTATPDETTTHKRPLLSYAYILKQNLSLWIEKPPLLSSNFGLDLPEQEPYDGHGTIHLQDGMSGNCLREQAILTEIQSEAYEKLRSPNSLSMSQEAYTEISRQLLEELLQRRSNLPTLAEPLLIPNNLDMKHASWFSTIFCTFYQGEIAIRSSIFSHNIFFDNANIRNQAPSLTQVALPLLGNRWDRKWPLFNALMLVVGRLAGPFSEVLRGMLPKVAWNLDSQFLHIAYNRHAPEVQHEAQLIRDVVNLFEDNFPNYQQAKSCATTRLLLDVASRAVP